jgi:hypothetical protein
MKERAMAMGPGKYDDVATMARKMSNALGVIVVILGGNKGNGFSLQAIHQNETFLKNVPKILREMADQIENDVKQI